MMNDYGQLIDFINNNLPETKIYLNEDMKNHNTFKTGGLADLMIKPHNIFELQMVMKYIVKEKIPYLVLGHGSNVLVSDKGIREVVIKIEDNLNNVKVTGEKIEADAGALLTDVSQTAMMHSLTGFEFACGIPGTMGGAVVMNAGAYGGEIKGVLEKVQVLTREGEIMNREAGELKLGYRTSIIQENGDIVLKAILRLKKGTQDSIKNLMDELTMRRKKNQPLEFPSAGSIFKRPAGYYTGKLIQDADLRGYRIGGAQVSIKHAGFIINTGNATTSDILKLIKHIQNEVNRLYHVKLETEVKFIGEK
jgi:UDP-N-acetylmuramate dehydrogenase